MAAPSSSPRSSYTCSTEPHVCPCLQPGAREGEGRGCRSMTYEEAGAPACRLAAPRVRRSKQGQRCRSDLRVNPKAWASTLFLQRHYGNEWRRKNKAMDGQDAFNITSERRTVVVSGSLVTPDQSTACQRLFTARFLSHTHLPPVPYHSHRLGQSHLQQGADSRDHHHHPLFPHNPQEHVVLRDLIAPHRRNTNFFPDRVRHRQRIAEGNASTSGNGQTAAH